MVSANACRSSRQYFAALGYIPSELDGILIVNILSFIYAELANLSALAVLLPVIPIVWQIFHLRNVILERQFSIVHVKLSES